MKKTAGTTLVTAKMIYFRSYTCTYASTYTHSFTHVLKTSLSIFAVVTEHKEPSSRDRLCNSFHSSDDFLWRFSPNTVQNWETPPNYKEAHSIDARRSKVIGYIHPFLTSISSSSFVYTWLLISLFCCICSKFPSSNTYINS